MSLFSSMARALVAGLALTSAAHADIRYDYFSAMGPQMRLNGAFTAPPSAIADGLLSVAELSSAHFVLSDPYSPFRPATFELSEFGSHIHYTFGGLMYVDRVSGEPLNYYRMTTYDAETDQILTLTPFETSLIVLSLGVPWPWFGATLQVSGGGPGAVSGGAGSREGDFLVYAYDTTSAAPGGGRLSGSFVVPRPAIADGKLTFDELTTVNFTLTDTSAPFVPATFTRDDFGGHLLGLRETEGVRVDPATGTLLHDFLFSPRDADTGMSVHVFPGHFVVLRSGRIAYGLGDYAIRGTAPRAVPAIGAPMSAMLFGGLALVAVVALRRRA